MELKSLIPQSERCTETQSWCPDIAVAPNGDFVFRGAELLGEDHTGINDLGPDERRVVIPKDLVLAALPSILGQKSGAA